MNSFTLTAVGNLANNPEFSTKSDTSYTRFCLVGNDYAGKDEGGTAREIATSLWFVAFGVLGEALARNARKGDQLIVEAHVRANNWTDKQGEKQYDHSFILDGFRFGAPFAVAQAQNSPFMTGATALQTNILAWLTPIAIILVMILGAMAMANRMSWGWCLGAILGIAIAFGAPQIVAWVRGMFGV